MKFFKLLVIIFKQESIFVISAGPQFLLGRPYIIDLRYLKIGSYIIKLEYTVTRLNV